MKYFSTQFVINPASEDTRALIMWAAGEAGYESFEDTEEGVIGYIQVNSYNEEALINNINEISYEGMTCDFTTRNAEDCNWNATWEQDGFEPIEIDNGCIIYDKRHANIDIESYRISILIDAEQAFGTGTHETTQLMISKLLSLDISNKNVLDCGSGTGILSIACSKLGAHKCFAYDIDEWSVKNTTHNAGINNVTNIETVLGDSSVLNNRSKKFDIILANINRNILLADIKQFVKVLDSQGTLLLSGFYKEDIPILEECLLQNNLYIVDIKEKNNWAMITCKFKR